MTERFEIDLEQRRLDIEIADHNGSILIERLLSLGWYLPAGDLTWIQFLEWTKAVDSATDGEFENALIAFTIHSQSEIIANVVKTWPHRERLIQSAFKAHEIANFDLAIPVFLAQADGISHEMLSHSMFSKTKKSAVPKSSRGLDHLLKALQRPGMIQRIMLKPLQSPSAVISNTDSRKVTGQPAGLENMLNRHGVLHGIDLNYGTLANSQRCICILGALNGVSQALEHLKPIDVEEIFREVRAGRSLIA